MSKLDKIGRVKLRNVRLSYPYLYKPDTQENDDGEIVKTYRASFITCPGDPEFKTNMAAIKKAIKEVKEEKWGSKQPKIKPDRMAAQKLDADEHPEEIEGCYRISARAKEEFRPALVDNRKGRDGHWLRLEDDKTNRLYAGCRVNAVVTFWAMDHPKFGKRINCVLESVQFRADDEPFGDAAPVNPDDVFGDDDVPEDVLDDDDLDDLDDGPDVSDDDDDDDLL